MTERWRIKNDSGEGLKLLYKKGCGYVLEEMDSHGKTINTVELSEEEIKLLHNAMRQIDEY